MFTSAQLCEKCALTRDTKELQGRTSGRFTTHSNIVKRFIQWSIESIELSLRNICQPLILIRFCQKKSTAELKKK